MARLVPAWLSRDKLSVVALAALTSASVSLLTMWLGGEGVARDRAGSLVSTEGSASPSASAPTPPGSPTPERSVEAGQSLSDQPVTQQPPQQPTSPRRSPEVVNRNERQDPRPSPSSPARVHAVLASTRPTPVARSGATPALQPPVAPRGADERSTRPRPGGIVRGAPSFAPSAGLVVITEPAGARVTINGLGRGTTPLRVQNLPSGRKRIRVSMSGYRSEERVLGGDDASTRGTLRIELRQAPADGGTR